MTAGSVVAANNSTGASATWTVQPAAGVEWSIHNVYWSGACSLKKYDGIYTVTFDSPTSAGALTNMIIHLNNSVYLQITDTSGATNVMGYDGVQTL